MCGKDLLSCLRSLHPVLKRYALQRFGAPVETAGWLEFSRYGSAAIAHEKATYQSIFTAWWLYAWLPDDQGINDEQFLALSPDHAIAADYLAMHRSHLSVLEQRVIERAVVSPYSFYTLLSIEPDNGLKLQEIYTGRRVIVEGGGSISYREGDVLFCAVLSVDGVSLLLGCMPQSLDVSSQARIETHRDKWREEIGKAIDQRQLYLHDSELRRYYFLLLIQKQQATLH